MSTHVTSLQDKAGTTEWAIHLWFDNGHEVFAKHEELEATPSLEEAQAAAAARIHHLQQRSLLQGISGTWWGDLQRGIWEPIEHHDGDEVTLDVDLGDRPTTPMDVVLQRRRPAPLGAHPVTRLDIAPDPWTGTGLVLVVAAAAIAALLGYTKLAITVAPPQSARQPIEAAQGVHQVDDVTDGDSLRLVGIDRPIRLIGIDAPESTALRFGHAECLGDHATAYLAMLVSDGVVEIELGTDPTDRYDRLLAYVFLPSGGSLVNETMVRSGMAYAVEYPPNTRYSDTLFAAERAAQADGLGIWATCAIEAHR